MIKPAWCQFFSDFIYGHSSASVALKGKPPAAKKSAVDNGLAFAVGTSTFVHITMSPRHDGSRSKTGLGRPLSRWRDNPGHYQKVATSGPISVKLGFNLVAVLVFAVKWTRFNASYNFHTEASCRQAGLPPGLSVW
jgi:hypothetical protein